MSGKNPCLATCTGYNFSICSNVLKQIHNDSVRPSRRGPRRTGATVYTQHDMMTGTPESYGGRRANPRAAPPSTSRPKLRIRIVGMCRYLWLQELAVCTHVYSGSTRFSQGRCCCCCCYFRCGRPSSPGAAPACIRLAGPVAAAATGNFLPTLALTLLLFTAIIATAEGRTIAAMLSLTKTLTSLSLSI